MGQFDLPKVNESYTTQVGKQADEYIQAAKKSEDHEVKVLESSKNKTSSGVTSYDEHEVRDNIFRNDISKTSIMNVKNIKNYAGNKVGHQEATTMITYNEMGKPISLDDEVLEMTYTQGKEDETARIQYHTSESRTVFNFGGENDGTYFLQRIGNDKNLDGDFDDPGENTLNLCRGDLGSEDNFKTVLKNFKP